MVGDVIERLRGNVLLAAATVLACVAVLLVEVLGERRVIKGVTEAAQSADDWDLFWEGTQASDWYASRGMPALGFSRLATEAIRAEEPGELVRQAVELAAAEEVLLPSLGAEGRAGLSRLEQPEWAALRSLTGGHAPQEARGLWRRREYPRAAAVFAEVLVRRKDTLLDSAGERAYTCFLYGDTLKALGQDAAARRYLGQLAGQADDETWGRAQRVRPICDARGEAAVPWAQKARAELAEARSLFVDLQVTRRGVLVHVELHTDRDTLRVQLARGAPFEARFELPGAAMAGLRVNDRFLDETEPASASLRTEADGSQVIEASWRLDHDDPRVWRNGPLYDGDGLPEVLPLEVMLPLWARSTPTGVRLRGDAVTLARTSPLPTAQDRGQLLWSWGPDSPAEDRPSRLLAEVDLGNVNTAGIVLPTTAPSIPNAVLGVVMSAVVVLTVLVHALRRRDRPWLAQSRANTLIEATVAGLLAPTVAVVVVRPLVFAAWGRQPLLALGSPSHLGATAVTYWLVGVACGVTLAVARQSTPSQSQYLRRLGGLMFAGYLATWFGLASWWQLLVVGAGVAPLVWFYWLAPADAPLRLLTSAEATAVHLQRASLLETAFALRDVENAEQTLTTWPARIAEGKGSVDDFAKARAAMAALRVDLSERLDGLRGALNVHTIPVTEVVLGIGPAAAPLRNALAAVAFGGIPTLVITLGTGRLEAGLLIAHLAFFGLTFRMLRGSSGLEKAVSYGLALSALTLVPEVMRLRTPLGLTAALVEALLMLGVLMTAGVLMDALSTRRRWRTLMRLYDAPTVTRLFGGTAAAATAAAAGLLANGTSEVLGLLWGQVQGAFVGF